MANAVTLFLRTIALKGRNETIKALINSYTQIKKSHLMRGLCDKNNTAKISTKLSLTQIKKASYLHYSNLKRIDHWYTKIIAKTSKI